jgi:hypothetical protein
MVRRFGMRDVWGVDCSCCGTVARPCAIQSGRRLHAGYAECSRRRPSRSPDRGRGGRAGGCSKVRNFYQGRHLLSIWPRSDGGSGPLCSVLQHAVLAASAWFSVFSKHVGPRGSCGGPILAKVGRSQIFWASDLNGFLACGFVSYDKYSTFFFTPS